MVPPDNIKPDGVRRGRPPMRGSARLGPRNWSIPAAAPPTQSQPQATAPGKVRVLFVCVGNSCRSQMAEGFARVYGADVLDVYSAGLSPAQIVQPMTIQSMAERNVRLDGQQPKGIETMMRRPFELIVNMSGQRLPPMQGHVLTWPVPDPIGRTQEVYRNVTAQIEALVIRLILDIRAQLAQR